ncbi:hypothetical protein ACFE04_029118 [Oxalis oulophora]
MSSSVKKAVVATPHFFKIITPNTFLYGCLPIPKKFITDYGENLPEEVLLRVPSGKEWKIQLVEHDGYVCLQRGWLQFKKFYSIAFGYLLFFRLEANGNFGVVIFDQTASEINYPCLTSNHQQNALQSDEFDHTAREIDYPGLTSPDQELGSHENLQSDVKEVTLDDVSAKNSDETTRVKRSTVNSPLPGSSKRLKTNAANHCVETKSQADNGLESAPERGDRDVTRTMNKLTANNNDKTIERSADENPSFFVVMQPLNLRTRSTLDIPSDFARMHLRESDSDAILRISDSETWPVKYSCEASRENPRAKFYNGWSTFANDNNLKVGNVCVFTLIQNTKKITFSTRISRGANDSDSQPVIMKANHERKEIELKKEPEVAAEPPNDLQFITEISDNTMKYSIYVPSEFAKETGLISKKTVNMKDMTEGGRGEEWPVELKKHDYKCNLTSGWNKFFAAKGLSLGDLCVFEFVDGSLHVKVCRKRASLMRPVRA